MNSVEKEAVLHCLKAMIDEEVCEECPLYGTTGTDHCEKDCVRLAINALSSSEKPNKWIPCSERLPEDGRPVLIYAWNVHHVIARYDSFRTENGYKKCWVTADAWNGNTEIKHDVIAWMPLPLPYKQEVEG